MKNKKQENIVEIYKGVPRVGTLSIAKGFKREHRMVLQLIEKHRERFLKWEKPQGVLKVACFLIRESKRTGKTKGSPYKEIMLNKKQALFVGTLFRNTPIVLDFKERLVNDFVDNEESLSSLRNEQATPEYIKERAEGKIERRTATDQIEDFIIYAKAQGGTPAGCDQYYTNITRAVNKILFNVVEKKLPNLRDYLTTRQLTKLKIADELVYKTLFEGMISSLPYKEIFQNVKKKTQEFANVVGVSDILLKDVSLNQKEIERC